MILMPQILDATANENARYKRNELECRILFIASRHCCSVCSMICLSLCPCEILFSEIWFLAYMPKIDYEYDIVDNITISTRFRRYRYQHTVTISSISLRNRHEYEWNYTHADIESTSCLGHNSIKRTDSK